jgi:ABC-type antimicrobial peptide transport system permease subunit
VVAVFVSQRRREIGVRVAVGARARDVVGLVLRRTLGPALAGAVAGGVVAALTSRRAAALFYDTSPLDARAFAGAGGLLAIVIALAAVLPASGAARVDPRTVLTGD